MTANGVMRSKIEAISPDENIGFITRWVRPIRKLGPWMRFASKFSDLADRRYMSKEHSYLYLARRVREAQLSRERSRYLPGRIYNFMSGIAPDFIEATGAVLAMVMDALSHERPAGFQFTGTYRVRLDVAEELLKEFTSLMKTEGLIR